MNRPATWNPVRPLSSCAPGQCPGQAAYFYIVQAVDRAGQTYPVSKD